MKNLSIKEVEKNKTRKYVYIVHATLYANKRSKNKF